MSDDKKIVRSGEILPPAKRGNGGTAPVTIPNTGALISPYLRLKAFTKIQRAYNDYLLVLEQVHRTNTDLIHAVIENKRAVQRLGYADEILEEDRLDWFEQREANAHRRKMAQLHRDRELQQFQGEAGRTPSLEAEKHDIAMMRANNEKLRLATEEAELLFEKSIINQEERNARIAQMTDIAPKKEKLLSAREQAFNNLADLRGGVENFTDEDRAALRLLDNIEDEIADIKKDLPDE